MQALFLISLLIGIIVVSAATYNYDELDTVWKMNEVGLEGFKFPDACPSQLCPAGTVVTLDLGAIPCVSDDNCYKVKFDSTTTSAYSYKVQYGSNPETAMTAETIFDFDPSESKAVTLTFDVDFPEPILIVYAHQMIIGLETQKIPTPNRGVFTLQILDEALSKSGVIESKDYKKFMDLEGDSDDYVVSITDNVLEIVAEKNYLVRVKNMMDTLASSFKTPNGIYLSSFTDDGSDDRHDKSLTINGDYYAVGLIFYHHNEAEFVQESLDGWWKYWIDPVYKKRLVFYGTIIAIVIVVILIALCICICDCGDIFEVVLGFFGK